MNHFFAAAAAAVAVVVFFSFCRTKNCSNFSGVAQHKTVVPVCMFIDSLVIIFLLKIFTHFVFELAVRFEKSL